MATQHSRWPPRLQAKNAHFLFPLFALAVLGITLLGVRYASRVLEESKEAKVLQCPPGQSRCTLEMAEGVRVAIAWEPLPEAEGHMIRVVASLPVSAHQESPFILELTGRDMFMGVFTYPLQQHGNQLQVDFRMPFCAIDQEMVWLFSISFDHNGEDYRISLPVIAPSKN